ncbi:MAG: hypothetical protein NTW87_06930 [Planctomycetota bacterium]|nr:hypothetical protein [Planctomycetota bacterium]
MRSVKVWLPLLVALLCGVGLAAEKEGKEGKGDAKGKPMFGVLSEAPAGGDAKVLGVFKTKVKGGEEKSLNVIAANDEISAQIKELVKKGAKVKLAGELSADGASITVSKIAEPTEGKAGKGKGKEKDAAK